MTEAHEELVKEARERFQECQEAEREIREEAAKDLRFLAGDQWPIGVKHERELAGRPALTINKLPTYLAQVTNDARQNSPAIDINPVDSGADIETAEILQGIVRHIEVDSDAQVAYQTAHDYSAGCSFGVFRVLTEYCDERSFNQDIKIKRIDDPFTVWFDPHAREVDRCDAKFAFVITRYSKDEFKRRWPKSETITSNYWDGQVEHTDGWITDDSVQVGEYWYIEETARTLLMLSTGQSVYQDEIKGGAMPPEIEILMKRSVQTRKVKCATLNGGEVLEEEDWAGKWIPLIPVYGKEVVVEGKRMLFSLIRFARDPQALYNYYKTAQAETVGLSPKAPWVGVEGQFEGHELEWKTANVTNHAYLEYKPVSISGTPAPPPHRNTYEPPIQALSIGALQASDDIKATTGIFDASLGAKSNETSGIAIQRRQHEGDVANFHFIDNLSRAMRHCGRILLDLIPKIYDTPREVRIIGEDQEQKVIRVNQQWTNDQGKAVNYDLSVGKYDVTVTTGPSYTTQRQEAFAMLTELAKAYPALLQIAGDIIFRWSDVPGANQLADRMKKMLPPGLGDDGGADDKSKLAAATQQLQQLSQQNEQLTAAVHDLSGTVETKRLELESKERMNALNAQTQLVIAEAKLGSLEAVEMLKHEFAAINARLNLLNNSEPIEGEAAKKPTPKAA